MGLDVDFQALDIGTSKLLCAKVTRHPEGVGVELDDADLP